jgi:hypothetical protein
LIDEIEKTNQEKDKRKNSNKKIRNKLNIKIKRNKMLRNEIEKK